MTELDNTEKVIRFGCGTLFGGALAIAVVLRASRWGGVEFEIVMAVLAALACGWLAMKHGDRFWETIGRG